MKKLFLLILMALFATLDVFATSDLFPEYVAAPGYTTYFDDGTPNNVYHIRTTGNDSTGTGTYESAWLSLDGADGTIAAGDLILFHEGTYTTYVNDSGSWDSTNRVETNGTSSERIVIMGANQYAGYTGEAVPLIDIKNYFGMTLFPYQVLDGINFQGGLSIYSSNVVVQNCDFDEGCAGQRDGNPGMIVFPSETPLAQNITIINNVFHDSVGDHVNGNSRCYAIVMFDSNTNSIEGVWNGGYTNIKYNKFYNFNGATSQQFIIYLKDTAHGVEIGFNRFYNSNAIAACGWGQGDLNTEEYKVHDNLIYNCDGLAYNWGEAISALWYNNVVIDDGYSEQPYPNVFSAGTSIGLSAFYNDHGSDNEWGQVYDNVFYVDIPGTFYYDDEELTGYWEWVDYNAYVSTASRDLFENAKSSGSNWQGNAVTTSFVITVDGSYFATVPDDYAGLGQGRYSGNIGGFGFSSTPELSSTVIAANGTTATLTFDENVSQGSGYNDSDFDIDCSTTGNDIPMTYVSGNTTTTHVYILGSEVQDSGTDTCTLDFNGDANSMENDTGEDLEAIVDGEVTNNSEQPTPPVLSIVGGTPTGACINCP